MEELIEKEVRFAQMIATARMILVMVTADQNLVFVSDYLLQLTAKNKEEVLGKNWFDHFVPEEIREKRRNIFSMVVDGIIDFSPYTESEMKIRDGEKMKIGWHITPLKMDEKLIAVTCVGQELQYFPGISSLAISTGGVLDSGETRTAEAVNFHSIRLIESGPLLC
jgi:PAS domain S-box-containing protein